LTWAVFPAYNRLALWCAFRVVSSGGWVLRDSLSQLYRKVLLTQAVSVLMLVVAATFASTEAAVSALMGGIAVVLGGLIYSALARQSKTTARSGARIFARHVVAEIAKIAVVVMIALGALASGWFLAGWLVAGMVVALLGHGLAVFIIR
jgi:F0F1-type ATP synthase assembly protein I